MARRYRPTGRLLAALAFLLSLGHAQAEAQPTKWQDRARVAAEQLDSRWGTPPGHWKGSGAWQRFVLVDILLDYQQRTGDRRWEAKIKAAVHNRAGLPYNDDVLWAVLASLHAWQATGDAELLAYAAAQFSAVVSREWDNNCGGGLWWNRSHQNKNAITNVLLLYASTQLFLGTRHSGYREWSLRSWDWIARSGMIDGEGLLNDGLDRYCRNDGNPHYTYNQGLLIGGLDDLTRITGDPGYREMALRTALASMARLSTARGILREPVPSIGADGLIFKGVFVRHLGRLLDNLPGGADRSALLTWLRTNADAVWLASGAGTRAIPSDWADPASVSGAAAQGSGLALFLAAERNP